jgi:lysophospholipase L1-like esterase
MDIPRRKFLQLGPVGLAATGLSFTLSAHVRNKPALKRTKNKGLTVLFQGDSITDGGRSRNDDWNHVMGHGYAYLIASRLWYEYPDQDLMFYNRGVSGNKVKDLDDRWQEDTLDITADVLSILIGVNDVKNIVNNLYSIKSWKDTYTKIIDRTMEALPEVTLILCEPFLLPIDSSKETGGSREVVIGEMQSITRQLADDFNATFVELQKPFELACSRAPAKYWIWDGVHPMPAGHELIARRWIQEAGRKLDFIEQSLLED